MAGKEEVPEQMLIGELLELVTHCITAADTNYVIDKMVLDNGQFCACLLITVNTITLN